MLATRRKPGQVYLPMEGVLGRRCFSLGRFHKTETFRSHVADSFARQPGHGTGAVHLLRAHKISGWRRHVRVAVESFWLSVERRRRENTSSGLRPPSPQSGEGAGLARRVTPQPSTTNPQLAVRPDFVFRKSRTAIFVDGCFWHGCPKHATWPAHRAAWWRRKIEGNKTRDRLVNRMLRRAGWRVVRIWEHAANQGRRAA